MKKLISILLTGLLSLSLFACVDNNEPKKEQLANSSALYKMDTLIQDGNGIDKCFWEDGQVYWDNFRGTDRQVEKSAVLSLQTEYDMWFSDGDCDLDLATYFYPVEFEYDETKIEITANTEKENHFILKVLQPCDKEKIVIKLTEKSILDGMVNENGEPCHIPIMSIIPITISTEAQNMNLQQTQHTSM